MKVYKEQIISLQSFEDWELLGSEYNVACVTLHVAPQF